MLNTTIYYTGDVCNNDGWFTLVAIAEPTSYGQAIKLVEDEGEYSEGRTINLPGVHHVGDVYRGHCNPRFVTKEAYDAYRAEQLQLLRAFREQYS